MAEEVKDVNASESSTEEQVVEKPAEETAAAETTQPETTGQPTEETVTQEESKPQYEAVDEFGVPYKNRAMEWQRKTAELTERLPQLIQEAVAKGQGQTSQERQYSISELEAYAIQHPEYRPWVEEQKSKILQEQVGKVAEEKVREIEQKRTAEIKKAQSFQYVKQIYPEMFITDPLGNAVWNNQHPLTQQVGIIMQDPRFANDPDGLMAAADIAFARLSRIQNTNTQKKVKTLKQNLRKVQKQTLVEGAGVKSTAPARSERQKALEKLAKTGSIEDAKSAIGEILKLRQKNHFKASRKR